MDRWTSRDEWGDAKIDLLAKSLEFAIEKLAHYEDLEEQNLIHIAPCPNGVDIFFIEDRDFMDFEKIVSKDSYSFGFTEYCHGEFNKDWFLAREEAELKLKEMRLNERK